MPHWPWHAPAGAEYQSSADRRGRRPWPVTLHDESAQPPLTLRPLRVSDEAAWRRLRQDSADHVRPWEPTLPPGSESARSKTFRAFVNDLDADARAGRLMPWTITTRGALAGQVHLFSIVLGSQRSACIGYWVGVDYLRCGVATRAVALAIDHALGPMDLHRVEVNIRIDNAASLGVVRRLGLREEGIRERFLHIDGQWRDHRSFALTQEEWRARWGAQPSPVQTAI